MNSETKTHPLSEKIAQQRAKRLASAPLLSRKLLERKSVSPSEKSPLPGVPRILTGAPSAICSSCACPFMNVRCFQKFQSENKTNKNRKIQL
jgi:hypothetical protein